MKISPARVAILIEDVRKITEALATSDMITEKEAAALLNIKPITLKKKVQTKQVPEYFYSVSPVNGERYYSKSLLMGIKKTA